MGYMQDLDMLTGWLRNMNHITLKFWRLLFVAFHKFQFSGPLQQATLGLLSHIEPFCSIQVFSFVFACMNLASCLFGHLCLKISNQDTFGFPSHLKISKLKSRWGDSHHIRCILQFCQLSSPLNIVQTSFLKRLISIIFNNIQYSICQ